MKPQRVLLAFVMLALLISCEEDVKLGQAISDVRSAAPTVCKDYCPWARDCTWNSYPFEVAGTELEAARQDWQLSCVVTCANRASRGSFIYQYDWDDVEEVATYTFTEKVEGKPWTAYFKCLWDNELWICGEHGMPELVYDTQQACEAFNQCIGVLDVAIQYTWNPEAGEDGDCQHEGFDHLWGGWSFLW
jgi:hypothetical protein